MKEEKENLKETEKGTEEKEIIQDNIDIPDSSVEGDEVPILNNKVIEEMAASAGLAEELEQARAALKSLEEKYNAAEETINDINSKYVRLRAEFDNYKRRTDAERSQDYKYAAKNFILKVLPVVDDIDRSVAFFDSGTDAVKLAEGIKLIHEKLHKILAEEGINKFESLHKPFNVDYHTALMRQENTEHPSDTVLQEFAPGYMYKDLILRHAQVVVSENPGADIQNESTPPVDTPSQEAEKGKE